MCHQGIVRDSAQGFGDQQGYFLETYSQKDFVAAGLTMSFVQDNQSLSSRGVLRGLHFQKHHPQGKLLRAMVGTVYDVAVAEAGLSAQLEFQLSKKDTKHPELDPGGSYFDLDGRWIGE